MRTSESMVKQSKVEHGVKLANTPLLRINAGYRWVQDERRKRKKESVRTQDGLGGNYTGGSWSTSSLVTWSVDAVDA